MATHPGVYCLRGNETAWDAQRLRLTYTILTDLASASLPPTSSVSRGWR
jgi:hypothetical protein